MAAFDEALDAQNPNAIPIPCQDRMAFLENQWESGGSRLLVVQRMFDRSTSLRHIFFGFVTCMCSV